MTTVDWTVLVQTALGFAATLILALATEWLKSHMADKAARDTLQITLQNGLGAMQQAVQSNLTTHPLIGRLPVPGLTPALAAGIQYVLDNAGPELNRLGITPAAVASKLSARLGLKNIDTNIATAASSAPSPQPLTAIPAAPPMGLPIVSPSVTPIPLKVDPPWKP